jgi:hypothetical protein
MLRHVLLSQLPHIHIHLLLRRVLGAPRLAAVAVSALELDFLEGVAASGILPDPTEFAVWPAKGAVPGTFKAKGGYLGASTESDDQGYERVSKGYVGAVWANSRVAARCEHHVLNRRRALVLWFLIWVFGNLQAQTVLLRCGVSIVDLSPDELVSGVNQLLEQVVMLHLRLLDKKDTYIEYDQLLRKIGVARSKRDICFPFDSNQRINSPSTWGSGESGAAQRCARVSCCTSRLFPAHFKFETSAADDGRHLPPEVLDVARDVTAHISTFWRMPADRAHIKNQIKPWRSLAPDTSCVSRVACWWRLSSANRAIVAGSTP